MSDIFEFSVKYIWVIPLLAAIVYYILKESKSSRCPNCRKPFNDFKMTINKEDPTIEDVILECPNCRAATPLVKAFGEDERKIIIGLMADPDFKGSIDPDFKKKVKIIQEKMNK